MPALVICGVLGVSAGTVYALNWSGTTEQGFPLQPDGDVGVSTSGLTLENGGSSSVDFPEELADLGGRPMGLAFDGNGDLWFTSTNSKGQVLLGMRTGSGTVERYVLPGQVGGFPKLAISDDGEPVVGVYQKIFVVDPKTVEYRIFELEAASQSESLDPETLPQAAGAVVNLKVSSNTAYVSRYGMSSIMALDLESGESSETPISRAFGGFDDFAVLGEDIWLVKTNDTLGGPPSQLGILRGGQLQIISRKVISAAATTDELIVATWDDTGVGQASSEGFREFQPSGQASDMLARLGPETLIGPVSQDQYWVTDPSQNMVAWIDQSGGSSAVFELPTWSFDASSLVCPISDYGNECGGVEHVPTRVVALAVSPGGDLYIADETKNRIGIVKAPE